MFHTPSKIEVLQNIAREIADYDVVCLQEVDLGGRRAGHRCQVDAIAQISGHAHVVVQENRRVPGISRHGNAILSHWPLTEVRDLKLPGSFAGRGCIAAEVDGKYALTAACLHLSLGAADQTLQLAAVSNIVRDAAAWAVMGDFNCGARSAPLEGFCEAVGGHLSRTAPLTFPAWRPRKDYDHIVIGGDLSVLHYQSEPAAYSDHLPIWARVAG